MNVGDFRDEKGIERSDERLALSIRIVLLRTTMQNSIK